MKTAGGISLYVALILGQAALWTYIMGVVTGRGWLLW